MTAAGNRSAGRVNRNAAKRFDYEVAAAARSSAAESQRRHRKFESRRERGAVVGDVLRRRAVEVESGARCARLCVGPHIFRDVIVANRGH